MGCFGDLDAPEHDLTEKECLDAKVTEDRLAREAGEAGARLVGTEPRAGSLESMLSGMRARLDALAASPHSCPICTEKLLKPDDECTACWRVAEERRRQELEARERFQLAIGTVPSRFHWARFDAPELALRVRDRQAVRAAIQAVKSGWVVLSGNTATGKTCLAVCLLRARVDAGETGKVVFVKARTLALARQQTGLGDGEPREVRAALRAAFLVLDDLGQDANVATSAVCDVIDERHEHGLTTVITTGLTIEQVEQKYNAGIARRVFEDPAVLIRVTAVAPGNRQDPGQPTASRPALRAVPGHGSR